jgi:multicomponent Na+:H+ antiporter subunit G
MLLSDLVTVTLISLGGFFFFAGTVGLLRFPDVFSRLHALTKTDNLGHGFIVLGLAWESGSPLVMLKLALVWLLALLASAVSCHLIARYALRSRKLIQETKL